LPHDPRAGWSFFIDRGGTFTDVIGKAPDGRLVVRKLLSENPEQYRDAATAGVRAILAECDPGAGVDSVKMGTTVATNALLERKGEPTLLAITAGHADALRIGYQARPRLFDRNIVLPDLLYSDVVEIDERVSAEGDVLRPLDETAARANLQRAYDSGLRSIAIVLVHGYRHTDHETRVAQIARQIGFTQISVSHEVSPLMKLVGRGDTTVADAYLSPVLRAYVDRVAEDLGREVQLFFMQSNGGLTDAASFRGKDSVLSGPAGGVVGMVETARAAGFEALIGFDMGGTSTDVAHFAGTYERAYETTVAGVRLRAPMMSLHTVAAGGGSICRFDGSRLRVGPESAGANPGPCGYRRGGPLTVTDCNILLGKLRPEYFPSVFGPQADQPLDLAAVQGKFAALADEVAKATGQAADAETLAEGFLSIAVQNMARAIKQISVQRGHDVSDYTLVSFGGAGGQHACLVAEALGMRRVMLHPLAGVLSAYGMGLADVAAIRERTVELPLAEDGFAALQALASELSTLARAGLDVRAVGDAQLELRLHALIKYAGSDTPIPVPFGPVAAMKAAFEQAHLRQFGFVVPDRVLMVETLSAEAVAISARTLSAPDQGRSARAEPLAEVSVRFSGARVQAPVFDREALGAGAKIAGPALILEPTGTTLVEPGWTARVDGLANLILEKVGAAARPAGDVRLDPVRLELFNNLFMSLAEQMGQTLQNTAYSVNIKERLDFSCALFDADAALIANAPHMPVHLGSMGDSVRAIAEARAADGRGMRPGDVYMLNAPYNGGTHLPDVTVVMPVFTEAGELLAYVAARGHHGDIGGITPGSMPPMSRTVEDEGVLIDNVLLVENGRFLEDETRALLASGLWPARNPDQNIADLKAQVAACVAGAQGLHQLMAAQGRAVVEAYMRHVKANAAEAVRRVIDTLEDGDFRLEMDDGAVIAVSITVNRQNRSCAIDFAGTSDQRPNNFNAPWSVCRAAVLYLFRTLIDDDIPLNDGCMEPLTLTAPKGSMLNPQYPAAVVAGNVETSQAITDALYGALGALAASQGTMNNLTFGDERRQYYETICGGAGAGDGFDGQSAVQTHMTNSRLTDPEVLETRYPVILQRFAIRRASGGEGRWHGGDGVIRQLMFREPMTAAILSNRRRVAPFGLFGGGAALTGRTEVTRLDGSVQVLASAEATELAAGESITVYTPGGGGYGHA
jgi:5-oxoprolinase (ATP-hydrolysing)